MSWPRIITPSPINQDLIIQHATYTHKTWFLNKEKPWKNVKKVIRIKE